MATVRNVCLHVELLATDPDRRSLRVTYELDFEVWERSSWFREVVKIVGLVDGSERPIASLTGPPFALGEAGDATVARSTPIVPIDREQLDVEPAELVRIGPDLGIVIAHRDHIVARVTIVPIAAQGASAVSQEVTGFFEVVEL